MAKTGTPYGLTDKQWRFVQEYLVDLNATAAYKRAGYQCTPKAAEAHAARMVGNGKVAAALQAEKIKGGQRVQLTQDAVLEEIHVLTHSNIMHYQIDDRGNLMLAPDAPKTAMRAVASLKKKVIHTEAGVIYETEFRLWNKPAAAQMAGRHLGLFVEKVDVSGTLKVLQMPAKVATADAWAQSRMAETALPPRAEA